MLGRSIAGGVEFGVRVSAGSSRTRVVGRLGDRLKVQVAAKPERGKANHAVRELLAQSLGVAVSEVEIVKGGSSPDKVVRVRGVGPESLRAFDPPAGG